VAVELECGPRSRCSGGDPSFQSPVIPRLGNSGDERVIRHRTTHNTSMSVMERRLYALQIQPFLISSKSGAFQWILQIRLRDRQEVSEDYSSGGN
jgi:hypothetical protein